MLRTSFVFLMAFTALTGAAASVTAGPQQTSTSSTRKPNYHRLPAHYGKLELTDDQVSEIYGIKDEFGPQIAELQAQLDALRLKQKTTIEEVLTKAQRDNLEKITSSRSTSTSRTEKKSTTETAATETATKPAATSEAKKRRRRGRRTKTRPTETPSTEDSTPDEETATAADSE